MGLKKICPFCGCRYFSWTKNHCPQCDNIDFANIDIVYLADAETAYRIETEEEFDIVMSDFLTTLDGWQHYETQTVEYEVPDGEDYTFLIIYKNGTHEYRRYHSSSPIAQRLLSQNFDVEQEVNRVINAVADVFSSPSGSDYSVACDHFKQMQQLYGLDEESSLDDYVKATEIKMSSLIISSEKEFEQSLYELLLYLLSTEEDGDILRKVQQGEVAFCQRTEQGVDGFVILPKGEAVTNKTVMHWERTRQKNGYRKMLLLTTGSNQAGINNPNILVWDMAWLCMAYQNAFKKVVKTPDVEMKPTRPNEKFAVIDFETTGLNYDFRRPPMDEILAVAIVDQDGNELLYTYCDTIEIKSWYEAQCIHGIAPKDVRGCPNFVDIMPQVIEILQSYDYVISYNVPFEKFFLENYARKYTPLDFSVGKIRWGEDPMEMFMDYMGSRKFLNLESAAAHFGYRYAAHNALEDARAALYVYNALRDEE